MNVWIFWAQEIRCSYTFLWRKYLKSFTYPIESTRLPHSNTVYLHYYNVKTEDIKDVHVIGFFIFFKKGFESAALDYT